MVLPPAKAPVCGVFCDTLSFTLTYPSLSRLNSDQLDLSYSHRFMQHLRSWFDLLDCGITVDEPKGYGGRFYKNKAKIIYKSSHDGYSDLGTVFFDGNKETINILFTGELCEFLNMHDLFKDVHDHLKQYDTKITRCDLAIDFHDGEFNHTHVRTWYEAGQFGSDGRPPELGVICKNSFDFDKGHSRTVYVGSRQSTKYFRAYEKGHQLGDLDSKWVRFEIEYKANNGAILPLDLLVDGASYFREAYPAFSNLPEECFFNAEPKKIRSSAKLKIKLTIEQCSENVKIAYGRVLNVLLTLGQTPDQILRDLARSGLPSRLVVPDMEPDLSFQDAESFGESSFGALPI